MMAEVPCLMEREVKESQLIAVTNSCASLRVSLLGSTRESKKSSCVSLDKFLKSIAKPKPN